jgi:3-mercaptopyruvate sulfurtransferase SseA
MIFSAVKSRGGFDVRIVSGFAIGLAINLLVGCASSPTIVKETTTRGFGAAPQLLGPIQLDEKTIILDARSAFDYSMARIPRSQNINWVDFSERELRSRGWPQQDVFAAARRLARMGISPESKVVVFGLGLNGQGEEGRVAWLLAYLGVENVQFARFGSIKSRITTEAVPETSSPPSPQEEAELTEPGRAQEPPVEAVPLWKPSVEGRLLASKSEILGAFQNRATERPWSFEGRPAKRYRILDVRPSREYLGKSGGLRARAIPNFDALNVPWKEFFDVDFRVVPEIGDRLQSIGFATDDRILVIDNDGLASAAVTMALRAMGFKDAGLFAGGYNDLMEK